MAQKLSKTTIAQKIGVSYSTIYRELSRRTLLQRSPSDKGVPWTFGARNADKRSGKYKATLAHQKCTNRHSNKPKKIRFTEAVRQQTEDLLKQDYSPEQVCPRDSSPCQRHPFPKGIPSGWGRDAFGIGVESSELLIRIPCQQKGYISTSGRIKNKEEPFSDT